MRQPDDLTDEEKAEAELLAAAEKFFLANASLVVPLPDGTIEFVPVNRVQH